MAQIMMTKGNEQIYVTDDAGIIAAHEVAGWTRASIDYLQQSLNVPIGAVSKRDGATALQLVHLQYAPALGTATGIHAAIALTDAVQTIVTGITQPDCPRLLTIKGNATGNAGDVVLHGTNARDEVISETLTLVDDTEVTGTLAFKTLTSIDLPIETHAGTDTVSIGMADVIGISHALDYASQLLIKLFNGATDAGTLAVDDAVELNLFTPDGTLDGSKLLDLYYLA